MTHWYRTTLLDSPDTLLRQELWEYRPDNAPLFSFPVEVRIGKPLDIVSLKNSSLAETAEYAAFLADTARQLYHAGNRLQKIPVCPCCQADTDGASPVVTIFGVAYHRCTHCGHGFVREQPSAEDLDRIFAESETHSNPYIDPATLEIRLSQIIQPKLDWMLQHYRRLWQRHPISVLDVGAGGGHFVAGCRRSGLKAEGYELSQASRHFAQAAFGIELNASDFLQPSEETYDAVTFWGLLEYTPQLRRFLEAARTRLSPEALLVVEVPRLNCLGTAIQGCFPAQVARHMDPTSHVNCFSDASLATALYQSGFKPVAAWYFGMDAYELLIQLALAMGEPDFLSCFAHLIPALQATLDSGYLCDDVIVAAVPA